MTIFFVCFLKRFWSHEVTHAKLVFLFMLRHWRRNGLTLCLKPLWNTITTYNGLPNHNVKETKYKAGTIQETRSRKQSVLIDIFCLWPNASDEPLLGVHKPWKRKKLSDWLDGARISWHTMRFKFAKQRDDFQVLSSGWGFIRQGPVEVQCRCNADKGYCKKDLLHSLK